MITLSQSALQHNVGVLRSAYPNRQLFPCVKSNAYGHGLIEVVTAIANHVDGLCVVSTAEAQRIRPLMEKPIFVLNIVDPDHIEWCAHQNVILPLANEQQAQWYGSTQAPVRVHLEIDTGMVRTGFFWTSPEHMADFAKTLSKNVMVEGIYSHFTSPDLHPDFTREQIARFLPFVQEFQSIFGREPIIHMDKTDSLLEGATDHLPHVSAVWARPGRGLYGFGRKDQPHGLQPVLSWKTTVLDLHKVTDGESVGYDRTFVADHDCLIATLPIGYADGFSRLLSNKGAVLIGGQRCPIRGLVCMNMTMVEVPDTVDVSLGDEVVVIGEQLGQEITAIDHADWIGTSPYEVVTRISPSIFRELSHS